MDITFSEEKGILIVSISGRIDAVTSPELEKAIISRIDGGAIKMLFDLHDLEYISSAGLRVFLFVAKRINSLKGKVVFCSLQKLIDDVFRVSGFYSLFSIYKDRQEALSSF